MDTTVYIAGCDRYDFDRLKTSVDAIFDALHLETLIHPGAKVVLKPNLLLRSKPEAAVVTHPLVVAAVGTKVKELGGTVKIAESGGGPYTSLVLKSSYGACGYAAMAKTYGLELNYDCGYTEVKSPEGQRCKAFPVINPLLEADVIIDVAKLKSHCLTGLSGATKNMFGSVPGLMKPEFHCRFPDKKDFGMMLVDLCETVRPHIVIVDGVTAMEGNGPSGGRPRQIGALLGGTSPYCVDLVCARLIHMEPREIQMLDAAIERQLCPDSIDGLTLLGDPVEQFAAADFLQPESKSNDFIGRVPKFLRPLADKIATPRPKIRTRDCVGCGKCAESCPQHTIQIKEKKAVISYNKCIKCFCCHEMCPARAIDIQRLTLFNL